MVLQMRFDRRVLKFALRRARWALPSMIDDVKSTTNDIFVVIQHDRQCTGHLVAENSLERV